MKALDLISLLAQGADGLSVSEIGRQSGLPRTSVYRILSTLERYGLAVKDGNHWLLTSRFHKWRFKSSYEHLRNQYHSTLLNIAGEVQELVELGVYESTGVYYVDWVQGGEHSIVVEPRSPTLHSLSTTATGKLYLSILKEKPVDVSSRKLQRELEEIRLSGVAWNLQESDKNLIALATWAGPPDEDSPVICVKWPFFRFRKQAAERALASIRKHLAALAEA